MPTGVDDRVDLEGYAKLDSDLATTSLTCDDAVDDLVMDEFCISLLVHRPVPPQLDLVSHHLGDIRDQLPGGLHAVDPLAARPNPACHSSRHRALHVSWPLVTRW
jgi:hypothetical protein